MINRSDLTFLQEHLPLFDRLAPDERELLAATCTGAAYGPGELILSKDRECNGLVLVKSGQLRAFFEAEDGKEITLYRLLAGDICILSAACVLKNLTFEVTLETEKKSAVLFIPASVWGKLTEKNSAAKEFSLELVNERFSEVMWVMEQMVSKNMGQRVASFLLEQAALEGSDTLTLTHEAIAKNLGTAREVVSRILKYLENDGLVRLSRGQLRLTDEKRLREMSR